MKREPNFATDYFCNDCKMRCAADKCCINCRLNCIGRWACPAFDEVKKEQSLSDYRQEKRLKKQTSWQKKVLALKEQNTIQKPQQLEIF